VRAPTLQIFHKLYGPKSLATTIKKNNVEEKGKRKVKPLKRKIKRKSKKEKGGGESF
jgi:hypothetical protein